MSPTYEPALCLRLTARNVKTSSLYVIYAADGTQLDVMEDTPATVPLWVAGLVQLATVDVLPSEYKRWKSAAAALKA